MDNSPPLSVAIENLLGILIAAYRGNPHPVTGEDKLSPFEAEGYGFSLSAIDLTEATVQFFAIGSLGDDLIQVPSDRLDRESLGIETKALLTTIATEVGL